jgi:hypothetical protein
MIEVEHRVLGIEIYNDGVATGIRQGHYPPEAGEPEPGFSVHLWDRILATGRRCLGFCVPDHNVAEAGNWLGRIILLVPRFTEQECLRAYRQGSFYGCLKDSGLAVTSLTANAAQITVTLNSAARIQFVADGEARQVTEGKSATFTLPTRGGAPSLTYVRVEVADAAGERLFLQPIRFRGPSGEPLR